MVLPRENIEFKARDGTVLRGWFYPQVEKSACVIMTHGVRTLQCLRYCFLSPMKIADFRLFATYSSVVSATIGFQASPIDSSKPG
jgi:predicted RNA-binding protein with EMAP domain